MSLIVCQVIADKPDQLTFTWSDGINSFEPYFLNRLPLAVFREAVRVARNRLTDLVHLYLDSNLPLEDARRLANQALALAGHELYKALFFPEDDHRGKADVVRNWLTELRTAQADAGTAVADTFEVVAETDIYVPWNVVYDQAPPAPDAFRPFDRDQTPWQPFWGVQYNLACGRRVNPLRRLPLWERPDVILVIDPETCAGLPAQGRARLGAFIKAQDKAARDEGRVFRVVESREEFATALQGSRPYLVYWLSHATPNALVLNNTPISPLELMTLLRGDPLSTTPARRGLLFLNACQTGKGGRAGSFLDAVYSAGLSGLIATEEYTINTFAHPFGLAFLDEFLGAGTPLGEALHRLRRNGLPLGLLYTAYCPPDIHIPVSAPPVPVESTQSPPPSDCSLSSRSGIIRDRRQKLPGKPYRGLAPCRAEHRALFAGRDHDIQRFAELVNEPGARLLVLHGELGVGKSSFLEAGILPYLEEECVGYRALRKHRKTVGDEEGPALFIRASRDLIDQVARALCDFASRPYRYRTPPKPGLVSGPEIEVPLGEILSQLTTNHPGDTLTPARVCKAIIADPSLPARFLAEASSRLPFGLVMAVDQVEEIFTLPQTDTVDRRTAVEMLCRAVETPGDFRLILAVRNDTYGRFTDALRKGLRDVRGVRNYCLTELSQPGLVEAIRRPTSPRPIPYSTEVPYQRYGFSYADDMAERIARETQEATRTSHASQLLLMQVICSQLYEAVRQRPDRVITAADLEKLGGVAGGTRVHAETLLDRLLEQVSIDTAPPNPQASRKPRDRLFALLSPEASDRTNLKRMFGHLHVRQPDGRFTSGLVAEDELRKHWHGRAPFDDVVRLAASDDFRLLRENWLLVGDTEERHFSLGHDALAPVAAAWDEEVQSARVVWRAVRRGLIQSLGALILIAAVSVTLLAWAQSVARTELIENSQHSSKLTAEFAAAKLPWKVRRYWKLLEKEARDPELLNALQDREDTALKQKLHDWVNREAMQNPTPGDRAWLLLDARGVQLANSNPKAQDLVGEDFSYRDYFHGQGGDTPDLRGKYGPIRQPHLSVPFKADIPGHPRRVACSVPICTTKEPRKVLGVLVVAVDPQEFVDLPASYRMAESLVLFLTPQGEVVGCSGNGSRPDSVDPDTLHELAEGAPVVQGLTGGNNRWVAARQMADFKDHPDENDPHWSVVVAQRESAVLRPLVTLWRSALVIGLISLAVVIAVLVVIIPLLARHLRSASLLSFHTPDSGEKP
jgi:Novel STAND NTPase 1